MPIGNDIRAAGERLLAMQTQDPEELAVALNGALNEFLPTRFRAVPARAISSQSNETAEFKTIICDRNRVNGELGQEIHVEAMACVVDVHTTIDLESFKVAYERIARAKAIPKVEPALEGHFQPTSVTLGVVFAQDSLLPIEALATELDRLNQAHPTRHWVDVIVVLKKGNVNSALAFPGEEIQGDFLPPANGVIGGIPAYVHLIARPGGAQTLNRLLSILLLHVGTFSTGMNIGHNIADILIDSSQNAVVICGYQFTLSGELRPVPEQEYITSRLFPPPVATIQTRDGKVIGHIQYVRWQDGAFLKSKGFPLLPLLALLGNKDALHTISRPDSQLSHVLPLTPTGFSDLMNRFMRQSNMVARPPKPPSWTTTKIADEGSSSPFMARMYLGVLGLRDQVIPSDVERDGFDKAFEPVLSALESARESAKELTSAFETHRQQLANGTIVQRRGDVVDITENIDRALRREVETFLNAGVRALKDGQQRLLKRLGIDIGFLFREEVSFLRGVEALRASDPLLANYLLATRRGWSEQFVLARNDLHSHWTLPRVEYPRAANGDVSMREPTIAGLPVSNFVTNMLDHLLCFVEDTTVYALAARLPQSITLREIPLGDRRPEIPERFRISLLAGGNPPWELTYHVQRFEET